MGQVIVMASKELASGCVFVETERSPAESTINCDQLSLAALTHTTKAFFSN